MSILTPIKRLLNTLAAFEGQVEFLVSDEELITRLLTGSDLGLWMVTFSCKTVTKHHKEVRQNGY